MSTATTPTPKRSASFMAAAIASRPTDWPSLRFAFHFWTARNGLGSFSIFAPGTQPPAFDPKSSSRWSALIALCVLMPWRAVRLEKDAACDASFPLYPRFL